MNVQEIKFHPSSLDVLMTNSRSKSDPLSATTKSKLRELWIEREFGRSRQIRTPAINKGLLCEADALRLIHQTGYGTFTKNTKTFQNEGLIGTPDVVTDNFGIDIKNSWDLWTFAEVDEARVKKTYYYQMLSYMILTGLKRWHVYYCLVNTPEDISESELYKLHFQYPELSEEKFREKFSNHFTFDDIDPQKRVKKFTFEYSQGDALELMESRIPAWRAYLKGLSL